MTPDRDPDLPDGSAYGIRISLTDVKGISEAEVVRVVAGQPYHSLADFWSRAHVSRPVTERLVLAGGFDSVYGIDVGRRPARPRRLGSPSAPGAPRGRGVAGRRDTREHRDAGWLRDWGWFRDQRVAPGRRGPR